MKKKVWVAGLVFLAVFVSYSSALAKDVQGVLSGDVTWEGYIHVVGDVKVPEDAILHIEPGTRIEFAAKSNTKPLQNWDTNRSWIIVRGGIEARGRPNERITITSDASNPQPGDWACIVFDIFNRDSFFKFCNIEYGVDNINTTLPSSRNKIEIKNCIIRYAEDTGILVGRCGSHDIQYNTIYRCSEGIEIHDSGGPDNLSIKNNIITHNDDGINNEGGKSYTTAYNNVWHNHENYHPEDPINHSKDISVDPMYVSLAKDNDHLQAGSPCLTASENGEEIGAYGGIDNIPNPDIKANGSDSPITISPNEKSSLTISLDAGLRSGQMADYWIVAFTPADYSSFVAGPNEIQWKDGLERTLAMPIINFTSLQLPEPPLKQGTNTIFFVLDDNADGIPNIHWWDSVEVNVQP